MESNSLFNGTVSMMGRALDLRSMKHNLLASNIANLDTPNYKSFDIMVEEELKREMSMNRGMGVTHTNSGHLSSERTWRESLRSSMIESRESGKGDGNTVDIDKEMSRLTTNNLMYNAIIRSLSQKCNCIKTAINGGR